MSLRYAKIKKHPNIFLRLFGVTPVQFEQIIEKLTPLWEKEVLGKYKRPGRDFKLDLEDMVLMLLLYYRSYMTQMTVGFFFNVDDSRVCRLIRRLEPLLAKIMAIPKDRSLTQDDVALLIDATEQPIERPKKGQKAFYSGKKKRHTVKTEIRAKLKGRITHVSKTRPGSVHDFALHKKETPLPPGARAYVDLGYQGLDKVHKQTEVPYKKPKGGELDKDEKLYNRALSRIRIKIENVLAEIKRFRILSDRYRNKGRRYNVKFKIIAGIVNLKNGFADA